MPKKEFCPHCGQAVMKHKHPFSKRLARMVICLASAYQEGEPFHPVNSQRHKLTHEEINNFQKLKYWGLVSKYYDKTGERKSGIWCLTSKVRSMLFGARIPKWIRTFNNEVIEESDETTSLREATGGFEIPEIWAKRAKPVMTP